MQACSRFAFLAFALLSGFSAANASMPEASNGILDMRAWDFAGEGPLALS